MGGARPLAVHDLVEIVGYGDIGGLQKYSSAWALGCKFLIARLVAFPTRNAFEKRV
jgi:hypothetical protein